MRLLRRVLALNSTDRVKLVKEAHFDSGGQRRTHEARRESDCFCEVQLRSYSSSCVETVVKFRYVKSDEQQGDMITKPVAEVSLSCIRKTLMGINKELAAS